MKKFAILLAISLIASSAFALMDDGTGSLGIYFDNTGDTNCQSLTAFETFNLYVIIANPEVDNLGGFELGWEFNPEPVPAPIIQSVTLPPMALNIGDNQNMIVGLGGGLIASEATVLATIAVFPMAAFVADITVGPSTPSSTPDGIVPPVPMYNDFNAPENLYAMTFSTVNGVDVTVDQETGWVIPGVARTECPAPVATEAATYSDVKALFR